VGGVIRTVRRNAGLAGHGPEHPHGSDELPPVVAGAEDALGLAVGVHGFPASAVVVVGLGTVEADQGVRILFLFARCGKDRRVDKVVVVVGNLEEALETLERSEGAQCIAVSCVVRLW